MRLCALATFALFMLLGGAMADTASEDGWALMAGPPYEAGLGVVADMTAHQAVYLRGSANSGHQKNYVGTLERRIPMTAWRGHRLRLSLRLRNDGVASTAVALQINKANGGGIRSPATTKWKTDGDDTWRVQQFVLDVPDDAQDLVLDVRLRDKGVVWLDELKLQAVDTDVPVSSSFRTSAPRDSGDEGYGPGAQANTLAPDPSAYAPLVNGSFTVGGTPVAQPGSDPRH